MVTVNRNCPSSKDKLFNMPKPRRISMSTIARKLTGMTKNQLHEYDFPRVDSQEEVSKSRCVNLRQNVRLSAGLIVGIKDLNSMRQRLSKSKPKALRS